MCHLYLNWCSRSYLYWLRTPCQCATFEFAFSLGIFPHVYLIEFVLICFRYFLYLISTCIYHPTSAPTAPIQLASEKSGDVIYI